MMSNIFEDIMYLKSKSLFISLVCTKLNIAKMTKQDIIICIDNHNKEQENIPDLKIYKKENSYDYLLKMPIYSFTQEKIEELERKIKEKQERYDYLNKETASSLWNADLNSGLKNNNR